jgi:predicted RNA-binding Zn-ribbon protein involved in translation (DUF1610 family)
MRAVAVKITGEFTSTDIFKEKLTQTEAVNQAKLKHTKTHSKLMPTKTLREKKKELKARNNGHANAVDKPIVQPNSGDVDTQLAYSWCRKLVHTCRKIGHTYEQCWNRDPHANTVDKSHTEPITGTVHIQRSCSWCRELGHTYEQC